MSIPVSKPLFGFLDSPGQMIVGGLGCLATGIIKYAVDNKTAPLSDRDRLVVSVALPLIMATLSTYSIIASIRSVWAGKSTTKKVFGYVYTLCTQSWMLITYVACLDSNSSQIDDDGLKNFTCYTVFARVIQGRPSPIPNLTFEEIKEKVFKVFEKFCDYADRYASSSGYGGGYGNFGTGGYGNFGGTGGFDWNAGFDSNSFPGGTQDTGGASHTDDLHTDLWTSGKLSNLPRCLHYNKLISMYNELWNEIQSAVSEEDKEHRLYKKWVKNHTPDMAQDEKTRVTALRKKVYLGYIRVFHPDSVLGHYVEIGNKLTKWHELIDERLGTLS